jgi:hypothetical protein
MVHTILNNQQPLSRAMKRPNPSTIPSTTSKKLQDNITDILVTLFSDRIQVLISQKEGKIGTFLSCTHEFSQIDNSHTYHVETLLGNREDTLGNVYARQITERIVKMGDGVNCPPLLLGITLQTEKSSHKEFQLIVGEAVDLYQKAISIAHSIT